MTIAPFVNIEYDTAQQKAYVSVEDREVKKQREMWGKEVRQFMQDRCWLIKGLHAHISTTIFWAYPKAILRFYV